MKFLQILFNLVSPPKVEASREELYMWRVAISLSVMGLILATVAHFTWAAGRFPMFEDDAPASRREVAAVMLEIVQRRKDSLIKELVQVRREHCNSTGRAKNLYQAEITRLQDEFYELNKRNFVLPACSDFSSG